MGGRLDAVNIVDADVAVGRLGRASTTASGSAPTVEEIGARRPASSGPGVRRSSAGGDAAERRRRTPRRSARTCGARDAISTTCERSDGWDFVGVGSRRRGLPLPALSGASQLGNAAIALAVLESVEPALLVPRGGAGRACGRAPARAASRCSPAQPEWILDVAHNAEPRASLAASLAARPHAGRTIAVCGMLADKDVAAVVAALATRVASLDCRRTRRATRAPAPRNSRAGYARRAPRRWSPSPTWRRASRRRASIAVRAIASSYSAPSTRSGRRSRRSARVA